MLLTLGRTLGALRELGDLRMRLIGARIDAHSLTGLVNGMQHRLGDLHRLDLDL